MPRDSTVRDHPAAPDSGPAHPTARFLPALALGVTLGLAAVAPDADAAQSFETRADLTPPEVAVRTAAAGTAPGLVFVAPKGGDEQRGPMIYDDAGDLVFFRPVPKGTTVMDFRVQRYQGKPVLTWWEGKAKRGYGEGEAVIADASYREIARVRMGRGEKMDFHELTLTPQGTALAIGYKLVRQDLSAVKGGHANDLTMQNVVQEIDVKTGRVLFAWNANDHLDPTESYETVPKRARFPYDYNHLNSIDVDDDGNLLISARAMNAVYKIDRRTGRIIWRLGGKKSDFRLGTGARFRRQHDAERLADGTITIFDNNADEPSPGRVSRGIRLKVDERRKTAELVNEWKEPEPKLSPSQANIQTLPNRDVFIGWGGLATNVTEMSADGALLFDAGFTNRSVESYRGYRFPWTGRPATHPTAVATRDGDGTTVHASWNGATEVASWRVLGGPSRDALRPRATVRRTGFETAADYDTGDAVVAVEALDARGTVLGRSAAMGVDQAASHVWRWLAGAAVAVVLLLAGALGVLRRARARRAG